MGPEARMLVRLPNWLGDAVMALPALRYIRETLPEIGLHVAARPALLGLFGSQPGIDGTLAAPGSGTGPLLRALAAGKAALPGDWNGEPPLVGALLPNSLSSALWMWRLGARRRAGYNLNGRRRLLTDPLPCDARVKMLHFTRYYLEIAQKAAMIAAPATRIMPPPIIDYAFIGPKLTAPATGVENAARLYREHGGEGGYAVLAPMSAYGPVKDWPREHYRRLALRLANDHGLIPVLTGSETQRRACDEIIAGVPRGINLAGRTALADFVGLVAECRLFVGGDSGGAHVAAALGVRTLVIFGITNPTRTRAIGRNVKLLGRGETRTLDLSRADTRRRAEKALRDVAPDEVAMAVAGLLRNS
ncbi:MAG: glycosyltransferase family 9 protein [Planctomycetota bacterium]|jgi:heptosyltransferase-2|nr:glycosyltransferase family 9 protein [Planctomycetota bacterium]